MKRWYWILALGGAFLPLNSWATCNSTSIDADLGSSLGSPVISGTTTGGGDDYDLSCAGPNREDRAYLWTAPADGTYSFRANGGVFYGLAFADNPCLGDFECLFPGATLPAHTPHTSPAGTSILVIVEAPVVGDGSFDLDIQLSEAGQCSDTID